MDLVKSIASFLILIVIVIVLILILLLFPIYFILEKLPFIGNVISKYSSRLITMLGRFGYVKRVINLFAIMGNDIGSMFILMEKDIERLQNNNEEAKERIKIRIGNNEYDKVILTPLIMDFGYKGFDKATSIYYGMAQKPIVEQVTDLFNGIKKYMKKSTHKIFEIYPFIGINTQNYYLDNETTEKVSKAPNLEVLPQELREKVRYFDKARKVEFKDEMTSEELIEMKRMFANEKDKAAMEKIFKNSQDLDERNSLEKMLDKYFMGYERFYANDRHLQLKNKIGKFDGNIENMKPFFFAGVKVYPPLGFDPWPENDPPELEKVEYLYKFCEKRYIPITTHCGPGGFRVIEKDLEKRYTSPERWMKVLKNYPQLKLNFAHFSGKLDTTPINAWMKKIASLILKYDRVYTDFSCQCFDNNDYRILNILINRLSTNNSEMEKLKSRILFGTDFLINLVWADSYYQYLDNFSKTEHLLKDKENFCSKNPNEFLFGKDEEALPA